MNFFPISNLKNVLITTLLAIMPTVPDQVFGAKSDTAQLTIYAAASLTDVLTELSTDFESTHHCHLVFNFAGSNTLAQQIIASPRADIFLSANEKWMDSVQQAGAIKDASRKPILSNTLVVIAHESTSFSMSDPTDLVSMNYKFLATGDPDAVPAGKYAKKWLSGIAYQNSNVWDKIESRISPAPDVRSALAQVIGSESVIGIVYSTDCVGSESRIRKIYTLEPEALNISYPVAILKESQNLELAEEYLAYISSAVSRNVFEKYGFIVLE